MGRWNPWGEVDRYAELVWRPLPDETGGAAIVFVRGRCVVFMDPRLNGPERTTALAHELVHAERGPLPRMRGAPRTWSAVQVREEHRVDLEAARRLLPVAELLAIAEMAEDLGGHVTAAELAAEYEVTVEVAERAMNLLHAERVRTTG